MKILTVPNPKLEAVCTSIEVAEPISLLISSLKKTFEKSNGVGLAAPQIGYTRRIFIARISGKNRIFVNPVITPTSTNSSEKSEGCLSIPYRTFNVSRWDSIRVEAEDERRTPFVLELSGDDARVVQHENDHLDGKLISRFDEIKPKISSAALLNTVLSSMPYTE